MAYQKKQKNNKHFLYRIFSTDKTGKGVTKDQAKLPKNIKNFFVYFNDNFNLMFALNIFAFLGNFPILFGLYALTKNLNVETTAAASPLFAPLYGAVTLNGHNPVSAAVYGVHGIQTTVSLMTQTTKIFFYITLLVVFTYGFVNTASAYIMRNIVKGEPVSFIADTKYAIKRNFRQALVLGIIDLIISAVIVYDLFFFYVGGGSAFGSMLFGVMAVIAAMYWIMRYYMYIMLVTFDLSIFKILKNSLIFVTVGIKRNIAAIAGTFAVIIIDYLILNVFFPLGVILPVFILVSFIRFMGIYAAYPKIKEIMIDPYYVSDSVGAKKRLGDGSQSDEDDDPEPEAIFKDRG